MRQFHYLFMHNVDPYLAMRRKFYDFEFFNQHVTQAFLDEKIIIFHKYHKRIFFENYLYNFYNSQLLYFFINQKLKGYKYYYHNIYYRFFKAFKFESDFYTIGKRKTIFKLSTRPWEWQSNQFVHGYNLKWDIPMELYKGDYRKIYYYEHVVKTKNIL